MYLHARSSNRTLRWLRSASTVSTTARRRRVEYACFGLARCAGVVDSLLANSRASKECVRSPASVPPCAQHLL